MSAPEKTTEIYLGRVVKAFGIRGEVKFLASPDFWPKVLDSKSLHMRRNLDGVEDTRPVALERARRHGNNWVFKFEDIEDRNRAEAEVGGELIIAADAVDVDMPDHELPFQVLGSRVKTEEGRDLGRVTSVLFSAAHDVYEVTGEEGVVLIPAVAEFVVGRDESSGEITIRPIPGLVDG